MRRRWTNKFEEAFKSAQKDLVRRFSSISDHYRIFIDYKEEALCIKKIEKEIVTFNRADVSKQQVMFNNTSCSLWVARIFVYIYMWLWGRRLIHGCQVALLKCNPESVTLGNFIADLNILKTIGDSYMSIFRGIFEMQSCIESLQNITYLMGLPTDLQKRQESTDMRREMTRKRRGELKELHPGGQDPHDRQPLILENIEYHYAGKDTGDYRSQLSFPGKMSIEQGTLCAFIGPSSGGKKTLLRILADVIIPHKEKGLRFVPSHLRVLHVSAETVFHRGTLLENLTFGKEDDNPEKHREHVLKILNILGVTDRLKHYFDEKKEDEKKRRNWAAILSESECQILNIARSMVFNPEVLCMDKPTRFFDDGQATVLLQQLRQFVTNRGLGQNPETIASRRPRTCIISTERHNLVKHQVDAIFEVSFEKGIRECEIFRTM